MKISPDLAKAQANMRPGVITSDGFLGDEDRSLPDIIAADETSMEAEGITFEEAAAVMKRLTKEGKKGLGEPITVDDKWIVRVDDARGHLPSPFEDGIFRKMNVQVSNKNNGGELIFSDLSIHLLEKHHFLQGKGAPFRLEPKQLKKVLEL
jgi:hypothetical protein